MSTLPLHIHPAAPLLNYIAQYGAPVTINLPSTYTFTATSLRRGAHISARRESHFVRMELLYQAKAGHVIILPFSSLQHLNNLLISPVAAIPQDDRKPRLIYDYSYYGINDASVHLAPTEAMQFGKAFLRILSKILHADPKLGPTQLCKINLADGYMRVPLSTAAMPQLAFIVPSHPADTEPLIMMHLSLPMGFGPSCNFFEAITETIVDIVNNSWSDIPHVVPHRLSTLADSPPIDPLILQGVLSSSQESELLSLCNRASTL